MDRLPRGTATAHYGLVPYLSDKTYPYVYDNHEDIFHFPHARAGTLTNFCLEYMMLMDRTRPTSPRILYKLGSILASCV